MSIIDSRYHIIKERVSQSLLSEGSYPSLERVCATAMNLYKDYDANKSLIQDKHFLNKKEIGSKKKMQSILDLLKIDVDSLYYFLDELDEYYEGSHNSALNKMSSLKRMAKKIQSDAESLLLLEDSLNYQQEIFKEDFTSADNINLSNTDAFIDYGRGVCTAKEVGGENIFIQDNISSIDTTPITKNYIRIESIPGHSIQSIFSDSEWISKYIMGSDFKGSAEAAIKIRTNNFVDFSHIDLNFPNQRYGIKIKAVVDGNIETLREYKEYSNLASIDFDVVQSDYIIIYLKTSHFITSNNNKVYKFQLGDLKFANKVFASTSSVELNEQTGSDYFNKIILYSEEDIEGNVSIDYKIRHRRDSGSLSEWKNISTNTSIDLTEGDSLATDATKYGLQFNHSHPYLYGSNFATDLELTGTPDSLLEPKLLRNLGNIDIGVSYSSLYFYVLSPIEIDFETYPGSLNGQEVVTTTTVPIGIHYFVFNSKYNTDNYSSYLTSRSDYEAAFYFGSHLAQYIDPEAFVNIIEDDNYSRFSVIRTDLFYTPIIKALATNWEEEEFLYIYRDSDAALMPNKFIIKATLTSDSIQTPKLKTLKIKTS